VVHYQGLAYEPASAQDPLYGAVQPETKRPGREVELTFIPYYAWANREPSAMRVWVPYAQGE
jgi:DUF1680 family protein